MRLIKQNIERDGSGTITLFPEEVEDMWHAYNLIRPSDLLRASAIRRVVTESATGSTSSTRVHITLLIEVTSIDFDPQAGQLHVSGRVTGENKWVKIGAFHTLDLELNRNFTLEKSNGWDSIALDMVQEAVKQDKDGAVPAVVMQEGLANICLITGYQTILKQRVAASVPKKEKKSRTGGHEKGMQKFFALLLSTLKRHVDIKLPRPLLLASSGYVAADFLKFLLEEASREGDKAVLANKANFVVVHSSNGYLHSLNDVLQSPEVKSRLKNTKFATETRLVDDFMTRLRKDEGKAWYGPREVERAVEHGAVGRGGGVLLINNDLFRSQEIGVRKRWVTLVDKVKEEGGDVRVLSRDHESGKRLESFGGIGAILTFPLYGLDEEEGEDGENKANGNHVETMII